MWSLLWQFAQSQVGMGLILAGLGWLYHNVKGSQNAASKVMDYLPQIWQAAEAYGGTSVQKYDKFAALFLDAMKASLGREPTAKEMAQAKAFAERQSLAAKLVEAGTAIKDAAK